MLSTAVSKLTYANVMSTIAAFMAISGGAVYAATKVDSGDLKRAAVTARAIESDAVGSQEIAKSAVRSQEIAKTAVGSLEVARNAIRGEEIKAGSIKGSDLAPAAILGTHVADGAILGTHIAPTTTLPIATTLRTESFSITGENSKVVNLECGASEVPVGGGYSIDTPTAVFTTDVVASAPALVAGSQVWQLNLTTSATSNYTGFVTCMKTSG